MWEKLAHKPSDRSQKAKVEDRPGVTRDKQWGADLVGIDLLDTPGILWPKFDDRENGRKSRIHGSDKGRYPRHGGACGKALHEAARLCSAGISHKIQA